MNIRNSPTQKITFLNHDFYIKRDDLLDKRFSGNKARKFYYYLTKNFLDITTLVSYGSIQSNAMYSLSVLAQLKEWQFIYFVDHIPNYLRISPEGNYKYALDNGMKLYEGNFNTEQLKQQDILYIPEGGALKTSQYGLRVLANEIKSFKKEHNFEKIKVFLPSGTGTSALYLQKFLLDEVITCPCVGDSIYLKKQFHSLEEDIKKHPTILSPKKKYHFGKLYIEHFQLYRQLLDETNIEFDLLYDPIGWAVLLEYIKNTSKQNEKIPILYIHQGGLIGNESMKKRYIRKFDIP